MAEPLIEYFEDRDTEKFIVEENRGKTKIRLENFDKPIYLSKSLLEKAQRKPQKLGEANLWIYKDRLYSHKPEIVNQ